MEIGAKASATAFFGSPSTQSVFTAGKSNAASPEQENARVIIKAQKRQINQIRGYKLDLTPAENHRLSKIQIEVQQIQSKAGAGTVRPDELEDRAALLAEADEIIGKPTVDAVADQFLADMAGLLEALLAPKLDPSLQKRVDQLLRVKGTLETALNANNSDTLRSQFQSISNHIDSLTPPRAVSSLSTSERREYDKIAVLINDHVGEKIQLSSRETTRVAQLEQSISSLQAQLPPDVSQQPTPQQVTRAYTRL